MVQRVTGRLRLAYDRIEMLNRAISCDASSWNANSWDDNRVVTSLAWRTAAERRRLFHLDIRRQRRLELLVQPLMHDGRGRAAACEMESIVAPLPLRKPEQVDRVIGVRRIVVAMDRVIGRNPSQVWLWPSVH